MTASTRLSGILALATALATGPPAQALTLRFESSRDNTLYEDATGNTSNGAGQFFFAGTTQVSARRRGVVAFDVGLSIPPGTNVDSVAVILHMSRTLAGSSQVGLHRLQASWGEGTSDAALEEGGGTQATSGDATWVHRFFNAQRWAQAGGDFEPVPSAVAGVAGVGYYTWTSPALRADVQQWVDDPSKNFGWLLLGDESTVATAKRFDTHENPDTSVRPQLLVFIEPATDALPAVRPALQWLAARPSPFAQATQIAYELARPGGVSLGVHDLRGRLVRTLPAPPAAPGLQVTTWDGRDEARHALPAGSYFVVLDAAGRRSVARVVLLRR